MMTDSSIQNVNPHAEIVRLRQIDPTTLCPQSGSISYSINSPNNTHVLYLTGRMDTNVFNFVLDTMNAELMVWNLDALFSDWNNPKSFIDSLHCIIIDDSGVQPQRADDLCKLLNSGTQSFTYTGQQLVAMIDVATNAPITTNTSNSYTPQKYSEKSKSYLVLVQHLPSILTEPVEDISQKVAAGISLTPLLNYTWECCWMSL